MLIFSIGEPGQNVQELLRPSLNLTDYHFYRRSNKDVFPKLSTYCARIVSTATRLASETVPDESILTHHAAHVLVTLVCRRITFTDIAAIFILLEASDAVHGAHHFITLRFLITITNIAAVFVLLESMLTESGAHDFLARFSAFAYVAAILTFLEAVFAEHCTYDFIALAFFLTVAYITAIFIFLEPTFAISGAHYFRAGIVAFTNFATVFIFLESLFARK
jgi:hypothetical protein